MTPSSKLTFAPLYEQVKKAILNRIIAGEWGPGSFLPSEIALAKNGWSATKAREPLRPYSTKTVPCSPSSFSATGTENASTRFHKSTAYGSPRPRTPNGRLSSLLRTPKSSTSTVYVCSTISRSPPNGSRYRPPGFPISTSSSIKCRTPSTSTIKSISASPWPTPRNRSKSPCRTAETSSGLT